MEKIGEVNRTPATICEFEWRIPEIVLLLQQANVYYYSPFFSFAGTTWYIGIYPNGFRSKSLGYVFLNLSRTCCVPPISVDVSFAIKDVDGIKYEEAYYTKHIIENGHEIFGIERYLLTSDLLEKKSQLLPSNTLTIVCTVKHLKSTDDASDNETAECSYCEDIMDAEDISFHEQKCLGRTIKCPECSEVVFLINWYEHDCQLARTKGDNETAECSYWEAIVDAEEFYENLDIDKPIKCPECSEVVAVRNWYEHDCRLATANVTVECSHCEEKVDAEDIFFHEKKCVEKPIKCPECSEVVALRNWYEHECKLARTKGEPRTSALSVVLPEKKLLLDLKDLFLNKEDCDVVLKVKGDEFLAHKNILKARSSVFKSTFCTDMKEKATGVVEIEDCDPSCFSNFLCFLYCGDKGVISKENVFSLFTVADKYDVQDLREKCMTLMKENLSVDTFCDTITLALRHSEMELIKLSTEFFTKNAPKIIVTAKWQVFSAENPTKSNELFVKLLVPGGSVSK